VAGAADGPSPSRGMAPTWLDGSPHGRPASVSTNRPVRPWGTSPERCAPPSTDRGAASRHARDLPPDAALAGRDSTARGDPSPPAPRASGTRLKSGPIGCGTWSTCRDRATGTESSGRRLHYAVPIGPPAGTRAVTCCRTGHVRDDMRLSMAVVRRSPGGGTRRDPTRSARSRDHRPVRTLSQSDKSAIAPTSMTDAGGSG
jgi:hypothetical protein